MVPGSKVANFVTQKSLTLGLTYLATFFHFALRCTSTRHHIHHIQVKLLLKYFEVGFCEAVINNNYLSRYRLLLERPQFGEIDFNTD